MSDTLEQLRSQETRALEAASEIVSAAERAKRPLTVTENQLVDGYTREAAAAATERQRVQVKKMLNSTPRSAVVFSDGLERVMPKTLSSGYVKSFANYLSTSGQITAGMVEGVNISGGFSVPIEVSGEIATLAPQDGAIRRLSPPIDTRRDIKLPTQTAKTSATAKGEGSSFTVTLPALGQTTLSAFACATAEVDVSLELIEDAPIFQRFVSEAVGISIGETLEALYWSGSGSGQPQGLLGNVGVGVTSEVDGLGNLVNLPGLLDLIGSLRDTYHSNATFVMQRLTSTLIRKSAVQSGLYEPIFQRIGTQEYCLGYPVEFSQSAPVAARGNTPILFGDFKRAILLADRGGNSILVKVLDQANILQGIVSLLFFLRTDARVVMPEAVQGYSVSAS